MSFDKEAISAAYDDVRSDLSETSWAIFDYEGKDIKCGGSGTEYAEFQDRLTDDERMFGFVRMIMGDEMSKRVKFALITWIGKDVGALNRARMSTDKILVKQVVTSVAIEVQTSDHEEITEEYLRAELARAGGANYGTGERE